MTQGSWRTFDLSDPLHAGMLCLEASAGTGKTYTIEGMVTRLVAEEGVAIERLLVVTFTVAATAELKTRIRKVLQQARQALEGGQARPSDHIVVAVLLTTLSSPEQRQLGARRLRRAIESFDEAQIATIHSFCQRALRENTFESGAPFGTEMQSSVVPLFEEIAYDGWTRGRHEANPHLLAYLDAREVSPKTLQRIVKQVSTDPTMPRVPANPAHLCSLTSATDDFERALDLVQRRWPSEADGVLRTLIDAAERKDLKGGSYGQKNALSKRSKFEAWLTMESPPIWNAGAVKGFSSLSIDKARSKRFEATGQTIRHALSDEIDALCEAIAQAEEALLTHAIAFSQDFAAYAERALTKRKSERRIVSFDDLIKTLRDRVSGPDANPELISALQARYDVALIDEFQDTDPVQWSIFEAVFTGEGRRIIVVGDPKQAIYAFRGADIQTYLAARTHPQMQVAQLSTNHRSDAMVVDGIGHLFKTCKGGDPFLNPGIEFTEVRAHHRAQRFRSPEGAQAGVVISFLRRRALGIEGNKPIKSWNWSDPPRIVASQIVDFLQGGNTLEDKGAFRPVRPSDLAVLVRSNLNAQDIQDALRAVGVPSTLRHNSTVFQSDEAKELIQILEAVLSPRRAGQVRRALLTRLMGQDLSTLAEVQGDDAQWTAWMEQLARWRQRWFESGFATFARALTTTPLPVPGSDARKTIPARLLGWRDGERRITNMHHLIERLHEAALQEDLTPAALLEWLKRERADEDSEEPPDDRQLRLESDGDAVTIVTIHKAKGLEYPFVWCPYLWSGTTTSKKAKVPLRFRDPNNDGRWTLDLELNPRAESKEPHIALADATSLSEATRQLYVALTRAKHQVHILYAAVDKLGASGLGHILHPGDANAAKQSDEELFEHLCALAETSEGTIALRDLHALPARSVLRRATRGELTPSAKVFERPTPIDTWWRRTSFSGLAKATRADEAPVKDHDTEDEEESGGSSAHVLVDVHAEEPGHDDRRELPLKDFRGGTHAGTCIHEIYEFHDFQAPEALRELVAQKLTAYRFDAETWTEPLARNIQASLDTPLGIDPEFSLAQLSLAHRFDELDFVFPLSPDKGKVISAKEIGALMSAYPGPGLPEGYGEHLRALNFLPVRGFMVGSIDLIFEHQGRWYVVDYKSNNLGIHPSDYTRRHLAQEMSHSHYVLQYHIYCVALHRYLGYRLGSNYRFDAHFGGVRYLFMRGMSPDHAPGTGVFSDTPPEALIEGLSQLLGGE